MIPEKGEHHLRLDKVQREEDLPSFLPLHGIHFNKGNVRVLLHKRKETVISPSDPACPVDFFMDPAPSGPEADLAGQVNVPGFDQARINEAVDSALTDHDLIRMSDADVMGRLAFQDQRGDEVVQGRDLFL